MDHEFHLPILESDFPEPPPIDPSLNAPIHRHGILDPISGSQLNNYEDPISLLPHDELNLGEDVEMEGEGEGEGEGDDGEERVQAVAAQLQLAAQEDVAMDEDRGYGEGSEMPAQTQGRVEDGVFLGGLGSGEEDDSGLGNRKREYVKRDGASGLTSAEKKERQRIQNKRAAEKSRRKRRDELVELEATVEALQEENQKLQDKLQALRSNPSQPQPPNANLSNTTLHPTSPQEATSRDEPLQLPGLGIDYAYLVKIQQELMASKTTLLERLLEISRLEGKENMLMSDTRKELLRVNAKLISLKAEWGGLGSVLEMLKAEREGLGKHEELVLKEIEKKRMGGDIMGGIGVGGIGVGGIGVGVGVGGVDGEVEEMGRLVDAASNGWPA